MTAPKHTPGPWVVRPDYRESDACVVGYDIESLDQEIVGYEGIEAWKDNAAANACLIAAAPELYAALELTAELLEGAYGYPGGLVAEVLAQGRTALAKARGEG